MNENWVVRVRVVLMAAIITAVSAAASASGTDAIRLTDSLFVDVVGGAEKPGGEDSTWFSSVGVNWGLPLTQPDNGVAWGIQLGGDIKVREDDPEYDATAGLFARNLQLAGRQAAVALLLDYRRTSFDNDLLGLRPVGGVMITERDGMGLTGSLGLSKDSSRHGGRLIKQEVVDRLEMFWNRTWDERWTTELLGGYQFSGVKEAVFGAQLAYSVDDHVAVAAGGEINTDGHYAVGVSVSYHFGGTRRHATVHNIGGQGAALYTPFPKRSFPATLHRTQAISSPAGGSSGGGGIVDGDTGSGNNGSSGGTGDSDNSNDNGGSNNGGSNTDNNSSSGDNNGGTGGENGSGGDNPNGGSGNTGGGTDNGSNGGNRPNWRNRSGGGDNTNPGGHGNPYGGLNPGGLRHLRRR